MGFIEPGKPSKRRRLIKKEKKGTRKKIQKKSILERLPFEILFEVFIQAGVANNELPLVNKYFNRTLSLNAYSGISWNHSNIVWSIVQAHFKDNLNVKFSLRDLKGELEYYQARFGLAADNETLTDLRVAVDDFEDNEYALNADLFKYKFVSAQLVNELKKQNMIALEHDIIEKCRLYRYLFIKRKLRKLVRNANQTDSGANEADHMANRALEVFSGNFEVEQERQSEDNNEDSESYSAFLKDSPLRAPPIPERYYRNITNEKLALMQKMKEIGFILKDVQKLIISTLMSFDTNEVELKCWRESIDLLLRITNSVVTPQCIMEAYELIRTVKPEHQNYYYAIADRLLNTFYRSSQNKEFDDTSLWYYVVHSKKKEFLNMMTRYSDISKKNLLALMGT